MIRLVLALALLSIPSAAASSSDLEVTIAHTEYWEKPQQVVVIPVVVTNHGSSTMRVSFEIASNPSELQVVAPPPMSLEAGARKDALFTVQTPFHFGRVDEVGTLVYRIVPQNGDPQELQVKVGTRGFYVPGPQIFGLMLAIGVAALFYGRRGP